MIELGISVSGRSRGKNNNYIRFDQLNKGKPTKIYDTQTTQKFLQSEMFNIAQAILRDINQNLSKGLRFDGKGKVRKLAKSTIERKKAKGRAEPERVFVDSGKLLGSVFIKKIGKSFVITFKNLKYPGSSITVPEVARLLNEGTDNMPARPFFGVTKKKLESYVNAYVIKQGRYGKV